jgi:hypothetical protein
MIKCVSGKRVYLTEEIAEDVLIETRTKFDYVSNNGPVAVYRCDDCGYYHLTSKGKMNDKLADYLSSGKIQRQKDADEWLKKIKNRK